LPLLGTRDYTRENDFRTTSGFAKDARRVPMYAED